MDSARIDEVLPEPVSPDKLPPLLKQRLVVLATASAFTSVGADARG